MSSSSKRRSTPASALATVVASMLLLQSCGGFTQERPDVVVILIDTLRPDYLGFYGNETDTAPFLESLAANSTVLRRAYAASSWTAPSTASLFTSWYPPHHGVVEGFFAHKGRVKKVKETGHSSLPLNRLPTGHQTLPELFQQAGYHTLGLAANINNGDEIGYVDDVLRGMFERHDWADGKTGRTARRSWPWSLITVRSSRTTVAGGTVSRSTGSSSRFSP